MALDKTLKVRLSDEQLKKAHNDSCLIGKTASQHVRDLIVDFEVVPNTKKA